MKTGKKYLTQSPLQEKIEELQARRKKINSLLSDKPLQDDKLVNEPDKNLMKILGIEQQICHTKQSVRTVAVRELKKIEKELNHYYLTTRGI